jgi:hypothetical protein
MFFVAMLIWAHRLLENSDPGHPSAAFPDLGKARGKLWNRLVWYRAWARGHAEVTRRSNALDLASGVFRLRSARRIALSLKRSAEKSRRRKARPFHSAMSMLNFYINRAGRNLPEQQKTVLIRAKGELRKAFHKT